MILMSDPIASGSLPSSLDKDSVAEGDTTT